MEFVVTSVTPFRVYVTDDRPEWLIYQAVGVHVFLACISSAIRGVCYLSAVMASCTRIALLPAVVLKNTPYGSASVACRARFAFVERHVVIIKWLNSWH
jgi:hypothetical protein